MTHQPHAGAPRAVPWRIIGWGSAATALLIPVLTAAPWSAFDYAFAATMIGLVGLCLEAAVRTSGSTAYRTAAALAIAASLLLIWFTGAVGIIGSENLDANWLFLGVVGIALTGSAIARFRPRGMARAMAAAAAAEAAVPFIAYAFALAPTAAIVAREVPVLTVFFTLMWSLSAWLFARAAR